MAQTDNSNHTNTYAAHPSRQPSYTPSQEQTERAAAMRRFKQLYVYGPILLASLAAVVLVVLLFWGVFSPNVGGTADFASALADIILIMVLLPPTVLGGILAIGLIVLIARRTQKQRRGTTKTPAQQYGRLRLLLWRLQALLDRIDAVLTEKILPRVTAPVIKGHGLAAYGRTLITQLKNMLHRS